MDHDVSAGASPVPPLVPGLVLGRLLGRGAHGTVWEASDPVTGDRVAVKVGRRPDDARNAREAALLARVDHPHVVRLRNLVECPDGTRALVLELAAGGSLAALVAARGRLPAGEAVTVAVGLARTLADLHAFGLVHGDLTPGNVLLADDGRPLVADLGVAGVLGRAAGERWGTAGYLDPVQGPADDPVRDVHALGAIVRFCLTGAPDGAAATASDPTGDALLALADLCTDPQPHRRPPAAEVARLAWAAGPAQPLRLVETSGAAPAPAALDVTRRVRDDARSAADRHAAAGTAGRERRRIRLRRALRTGAVLAAAVGVVGVVAVAAGTWLVDPRNPTGSEPPRGGQPPTVAAPAASRPAPADVVRVVEGLAAARAAAVAAASAQALLRVDEAGSPALAADRAFVDRLDRQRLRLDGLRFTVSRVRVEHDAGATLTVTAQVATSAHRQVRPDGVVSARVPAGAARLLRIVLVNTADGWPSLSGWCETPRRSGLARRA